ncbi:Mitochondrial 18kDa protein [Penicillium cf. griseofulvum]|uniref:Mitochondrial fission process protein 1 n=1 Tax=Penicillium cf. griseofulvum TaxID=2972120 RepID=A0A9W9MTD4_9EURO|nr:Mitochondrial 18kDa protein [Penicillium cf. griseofulvum]KAJ5446168.1 Mitochondrial 18kDa protein [Penicillium cf. griseofulvum]KAJ5447910.1 Mitochondrial 18kDa protein [Penicillium cf. griseofulvum]
MVRGGRQQDEPQSPPQELLDKPVVREKLPAKLQQLVDREDEFYDDLYSQYSVDSTETPFRYAAYANRIRTILLSAHRYVAYTSDIGESFRPIAHPWLVRSAYAISWSYLLGDVGHEGYKAYIRNWNALAPTDETYKDARQPSQDQIIKGMVTGNMTIGNSTDSKDEQPNWPTPEIPLAEDYRMVMAKRAVFQSIASMGLPAFTIHSLVRYSGRMVKDVKIAFIRTWTPIGLGLAVVPFLPYIFDHPVDEAVEWVFRTGLRAYGGEAAVRPLPGKSLPPREEEEVRAAAAADLSWDEYKAERERARDLRRQSTEPAGSGGIASLTSWFGKPESESDKKKKKE